MSTYETLMLINETGNLIGQIMFDVLSVTFAILVAGFAMGSRLNNGMIGVIATLSAIWVVPMMMNAHGQFGVLNVLAQTLTPEQLGNLSDLTQYTGSTSVFVGSAGYAVIASHIAIYLGSIWFLVYRCQQMD